MTTENENETSVTNAVTWYDLDVSKIKTIADVRAVLRAMEIRINDQHVHYEMLKNYLSKSDIS